MSTAWDLYDSLNALELSSLPAKWPAADSRSRTNVAAKPREQRAPGSTTEKSQIPFISAFLKCYFHMTF